MIATGLPADGSDSLTAEEAARAFVLSTSQHLIGTPAIHPTSNDTTRDWMRRRAAADQSMQTAAGRALHHPSPSGDGIG